MIEIAVEGNIGTGMLNNSTPEEVEKLLHEGIGVKIGRQVMDKLDDIAFIDISLNEETNNFEYKAELVLCSKNSIITNTKMQAQLMANYGLSGEQIEEVLMLATSETDGF